MTAPCKVHALLTALPPEDVEVLDAWLCSTDLDNRRLPVSWLDGRRTSAAAVSLGLHREGHPVSATALKDHRGGRCGCYR